MLSSEIKHTFYFLYKLISVFFSPLSTSSSYKDLKIGVGGKDPMQNFSLLSQLLESKFGVTKCRIAPPLYINCKGSFENQFILTKNPYNLHKYTKIKLNPG